MRVYWFFDIFFLLHFIILGRLTCFCLLSGYASRFNWFKLKELSLSIFIWQCLSLRRFLCIFTHRIAFAKVFADQTNVLNFQNLDFISLYTNFLAFYTHTHCIIAFLNILYTFTWHDASFCHKINLSFSRDCEYCLKWSFSWYAERATERS